MRNGTLLGTTLAGCVAAGAMLLSAGAAHARPPQELAASIAIENNLRRELTDGYSLTDSHLWQQGELPANAGSKGIRAAVAFILDGPAGTFNRVFVVYDIFDDPIRARDFILNFHEGESGVARTHDEVYRTDGAVPQDAVIGKAVTVTCSVIPAPDEYSLRCTVFVPKIPAVILINLTPGPLGADRRNGEAPIETAFRAGNARDHLNAVVPAIIGQLVSATEN